MLFNTVGFIVLFSATIHEWKMTIVKDIDKQDVAEQLVKFIDNSTIQHINKTEIISGGRLYDIAHVSQEKGNTVLYCYNDRHEESMDAQLFQGLQQNTDNSALPNSGSSKSLIKQIVKDYLPEQKMKLAVSIPSLGYSNLYHFSVVTQGTFSIVSPPPRG